MDVFGGRKFDGVINNYRVYTWLSLLLGVLGENDSTDRNGNLIFIHHPFCFLPFMRFTKRGFERNKRGSKEFLGEGFCW